MTLSLARIAWRIGLGLVVAGFLSAGIARAQVPPAGHTPAAEEAEPYRIGAGDALRLDVQGRSDLSGTFTVTADGSIVFPVIGSVQMEGRTLAEVRTDLSRRISLFDRSSPQVTISIAEYKSRKIFILGAILLPGIYAFAELPNIWDAIAEAGGPLEDADLTKVELIPGDATGQRTTSVVDVASAIRESRASSLPRLRAGDTVRVPRGVTQNNVLIFGAVLRPGPLPLDQAPDLVTAILRSGGPSLDAKLSRIEIVRHGGDRSVSMRVNMDDYFQGGARSGNPRLEAGDTVHLPRESRRNIGVLGYVGGASAIIGLVSGVIALSKR